MRGAYVATPLPAVELLLPYDWDPSWPYPGAHPPGYKSPRDPEIVFWSPPTPDEIEICDEITIGIILREETHDLPMPTPESESSDITWYAVLDDIVIWTDTSSWSNLSGYPGATKTFTPPLIPEDEGKILRFSATSTVVYDGESYPVSAEHDVDIKENCELDVGDLEDCPNASDPRAVATYIGTIDVTQCVTVSGDSCTVEQREAVRTAGTATWNLVVQWSALWTAYCQAEDALEVLECELEQLECGVDEEAKAAKEAEITVQEAIRDAASAAATAKSAEADAQAAVSMAAIDTIAPASCQYYFSLAPGVVPFVDLEREKIRIWGGYPTRCSASWAVKRKKHEYWCGGTEYHPSYFSTMVSGYYTPSGQPYGWKADYFGGCPGGVPLYACTWPPGCTGRLCGNGCNYYYEWEVQLVVTYPAVS